MALPDPKRMAATNMISRDSADPGKFLDLLATIAALGVDASTGGAATAAKAGVDAATKIGTGLGTTTDLKPEGTSRLKPLELKPMEMPKFSYKKKEKVPKSLEEAIK
tara:strand:- start:504 stop:824 length:321 start_codon:yes stop_codon:yes gene_type:complete